jgi:hypothetical protein
LGRRLAAAWDRARGPDVDGCADLVAALDRGLEHVLSPAGFVRVAPRRWVRAVPPHLRQVVEYQALKGASYGPRWGVSLDFAPVLHSNSLAWKRTDKSAEPDLILDPLDAGSRTWLVSRSSGEGAPSRRELRSAARTAAAAAHAALADLRGLGGLEQVIAGFERGSAAPAVRFSLDDYVQADLAWGLAQVAVGDRVRGEARLARFCERFEVERDDPLLRTAEAAAERVFRGEPD